MGSLGLATLIDDTCLGPEATPHPRSVTGTPHPLSDHHTAGWQLGNKTTEYFRGALVQMLSQRKVHRHVGQVWH